MLHMFVSTTAELSRSNHTEFARLLTATCERVATRHDAALIRSLILAFRSTHFGSPSGAAMGSRATTLSDSLRTGFEAFQSKKVPW